MFISVKGVLASSVGVGGVPGIFSIMSRYWGPFAIGMLIVLILPFAGTYGYARLKRQNKKPAGRLLSGCPFSLSIQNITGGEENENRQHTMVEKGDGISNLSEEL